MLELRSTSLADTRAIAALLAPVLRVGDLVVLAGEMGAGKTALAQAIGAALGVTDPITSPTFTLVHTYDTAQPVRGTRRMRLHHADVYRLGSLHEVDDLAFAELLDDGVLLVEWGDVVTSVLGDHLLIHLSPYVPSSDDSVGNGWDDVDERLIALSATGPAWSQRWSTLADALGRFAC
jgi:tRNA threonylcarbamoyladenosine biosynthesis protein TsaE